jgi:ABC-type transport system involved in multi-copper enzyme maturation permease subunit
MTVLPVVGRELRVASRKKSTFFSRVGTASIAWVIFGVIYYVGTFGRENPKNTGIVLFNILAFLSFLYCLFASLATTCDSLSEEKRQNTLGLLFLTDLKSYDIVIGKMAAGSLSSVYAFFSVFPLLALPLLMGGVTPGQVGLLIVVLLNTLFLSLSCGMLMSSISRNEVRASSSTFLIIILLLVSPPLMGVFIDTQILHSSRPLMTEYWAQFSPAYGYYKVVQSRVALQATYQAIQTHLIAVNLMSWIALLLACLFVRHTWQDKVAGSKPVRWREVWNRWKWGTDESKGFRRRRLLNLNPYIWLDGRNRLRSLFAMFPVVFVAAIWIGFGMKFSSDWFDPINYFFTAFIIHTILKLSVASEAARRFVVDRRSNALELVLCTPLSVPDILSGRIGALVRQFRPAILSALGIDLVFYILMIMGSTKILPTSWLWSYLGFVIIFILDLITLAWVGMWHGMNDSRINRASGRAVARVMVLPWCLYLVLTISTLPMNVSFFNWMHPMVLYVFLSIGVNGGFYLSARARLEAEFRIKATDRFQAKSRSLSSRWFGTGN